MTHSLHRSIDVNKPSSDYVITVMAAQTINSGPTAPAKFKKYLDIFASHNPVNYGSLKIGQMWDSTHEEILARVDEELQLIQVVYETREDLVSALKEMRDKQIGLSVCVSGLADDVNCCSRQAGLKPHSINYSLGIGGNKAKLPDPKRLAIATMCGHAMISLNLIDEMLKRVKNGKMTLEQAAKKMSKSCICGIFNVEKAQGILQELM